jgi:hypothetical protein
VASKFVEHYIKELPSEIKKLALSDPNRYNREFQDTITRRIYYLLARSKLDSDRKAAQKEGRELSVKVSDYIEKISEEEKAKVDALTAFIANQFAAPYQRLIEGENLQLAQIHMQRHQMKKQWKKNKRRRRRL